MNSPTQVTAYSLASTTAGIRNIRVTTAGGTSASVTANRFTYAAVAEVTSVAIVATAAAFDTAGPAASYTVNSETQITAFSPATRTIGVRSICVTTAGGGIPSVTASRYTYTTTSPQIAPSKRRALKCPRSSAMRSIAVRRQAAV